MDDRRRARIAELTRQLLVLLGENPDRPGLVDTPARVARWWDEVMDPDVDTRLDTAFASTATDQMVVVRGVRVFSLCEHHLLPFWCDLTMGYLPCGRVLGLSKFARLARVEATGLNLQEGVVEKIAARLHAATGSPDVAVLAEGEHLCMLMRGARAPHRMSTSVLHGAFRDEASARQEFFHLARGSS